MLWIGAILMIFLHNATSHQANQQLIEDIWGTGVETTTSPSTASVTPENRDSELTTAANCECVIYYQCSNGTFNTNGEGIIDIRMGDCPSYFEVCCKHKDILPPPSPTPAPKPQGCGYRNPNGVGFKISGNRGGEAEFGEFPWMVAIFSVKPGANKKIRYHCGGSLIHPEVVLTAAHCVKGRENLRIRAGEWDTQTEKEPLPYQERQVASLTTYSDYYAGALHNDVALLFLDNALVLDRHIGVACLPLQDAVVDEARCFSSGWGRDRFGEKGSYQVILKKIDLPMVPRERCQENLRKTRLGKHFLLHESFVCAGGELGKDTCKGDGGSPLVCPLPGQENRYFQVGMVAWGVGCGQVDVPGVYVNVPLFRNWIDSQLKNKSIDISTYHYE